MSKPLVIEPAGVSVEEGVAFLGAAGTVVEAARERFVALVSAYNTGEIA